MIYQKVKADGKARSFILKSVNGYFHRFAAPQKNISTYELIVAFFSLQTLYFWSLLQFLGLKYLIEYPFWEFKYHTRISEKWGKKITSTGHNDMTFTRTETLDLVFTMGKKL